MTCPATHVVTLADLDAGATFANTATADSAQTASEDASVTVDLLQDPDLTIVKSETSTGPYTLGQTISYSIVVTNTGNVTLTGVTVTDPNATLGTCTIDPLPASLAPGATLTCPATHVVTLADLDAGAFTNTAIGVSDQTAPVTGSDTVTFTPAPAISLTKTGTLDMTVVLPADEANIGDIINYTLTATNIGNVTLSNVSISDPLLGSLTCTPSLPTSLEPTESLVCTGSYTLDQDDLDQGDVQNTATVTGTPPTGNPITDDGGTTVTIEQTPILGIAKDMASVVFISAGTYDVTFTLLVENLGNVNLTNLQVSDDLAAAFPSPTTFTIRSLTSSDFTVNPAFNGSTNTDLLTGSDSLAPGETGSIVLVIRVVPADNGPFENTAIASGNPPSGDPVDDGSQTGDNPDPDGDGDPTNNNDPTPITFGPRLFDPPMGIKTFDETGLPILRWTMVWINDSNVVGIAARVSDPIPAGTTYLAVGASSGYPIPTGAPSGSSTLGISCTPDASSSSTTTTLCYYEGPSTTYPRGRIIWEGTLGPDLGATDAASADNEISISFNLSVGTGITSVRNTATIDSDLNGDGDVDDAGEVQVASATAEWTLVISPIDVEDLPDTGFAPSVVTSIPPQPSSEIYTDYNDLGIEIPSLGVKTSIVGLPFSDNGWDATWLGNSAGWLGGTAFPTWKGNSVITGHVYNQTGAAGPFVNLAKLKWGDRIIINAFGQKYIYEVRSIKFIEPDDTSILGHKAQTWVTLLTCKEFDEKTQSYRWRVAVQAVLISVENAR